MKTTIMAGHSSTVFAARQSVKENTYELFIYDDITKYGDFNWETWQYDDSDTSAKRIREILNQIPEGTQLDIHINSNGGEVSEAVTIYNLLKQFGGHKTAYVDGVAHSAAFILLFACDHVVMGLGTACLFHNMWTMVQGNAEQLRQAADQLDAMMESNRKIYMQKAKGITEEELKAMMDAEMILTPEKCLELGFCDEIGGSEVDPVAEQKNADTKLQQLRQMEMHREAMLRQMQLLNEPLQRTQHDLANMQPHIEEKPAEEQVENETQNKALSIMSAFLMASERR